MSVLDALGVCRLPVAVALAAGLVASCGSTRLGGGGASGLATGASRTTVEVASHRIVIEGPRGFCVDRPSSETKGDLAFVVLANCRVVVPGSHGPEPGVRALLTASVLSSAAGQQTVSGSQERIDRFFRSETGRRALSRDSDPSTVTILDTFRKDGAYYLRARDTSQPIVPGGAADFWRSYFDLDGQIVSLSVIGFSDDPLPPEKGLDTVREFARQIRARNRAAGRAPVQTRAVPESVATAEKPAAEKGEKAVQLFWRLGLLRKLLTK